MQLQRDFRVSHTLLVQRVQDTAAMSQQREAVASLFRDGSAGSRWGRKHAAISTIIALLVLELIVDRME